MILGFNTFYITSRLNFNFIRSKYTNKMACNVFNRKKCTAMQSASRQSLELREAVEEVAVRVSGIAGDIVQLLHVSRAYAKREHDCARVLQQMGCWSWITAVAEAVGYQKYHFARSFATLLENCLANSENGRLDLSEHNLSSFD